MLSSPKERVVRFRATLSLGLLACTLVGSRCACANDCSSTLALTPPYATATADASVVLLDGGPVPSADEVPVDADDLPRILSCTGDEGSICCPFDLPRATDSAEVIVEGRLRRSQIADSMGERMTMISRYKLCRVGG